MFVGVCRLTFQLIGVSSLKGKRSIMRRMIERTKVKFNASVAEVSDNDSHQRGVVGVAVVGNERGHVDAMISSVIRFIEQVGTAPIVGVETEIIPLRGDIGDGTIPSLPISHDRAFRLDEMTSSDFDEDSDDEEEEDI
jgi:uncharacterized protein YlxP (DUF503 family)